MATLQSPNVQISVKDNALYQETFPTTVPLFILATREGKSNPDGTGIAAGTLESNVLRSVTSQREVLQLLGNPVFVTSAGSPVDGDETNEYGVHALWNFMATSSLAYYARADINLGQLAPVSDEPANPPVDGTYWLPTNGVVGGFFRRNAANTAWDSVVFDGIYTTEPLAGDGAIGDIVFDYSTANGVIKLKTNGTTWSNIGSTDLSAVAVNGATATNADLWISNNAPLGAGENDYWWKTSASSGGYNLGLTRYRAADATWVPVDIIRSLTEPLDKTQGLVWEDLSTTTTNGNRPLKVSNGTTYSALTFVINETAPTSAPLNGDLWYSDAISDFALYKEANDLWVEIETTSVANPSANQKVISASAPATPATGAHWVDLSGDNFYNFPVIKRYNGISWEDITQSVTISSTYVAPNLVANGSIWLNLDDPSTKCTVKEYDTSYQPVTIVDGVKATWTSEDGHWKPIAGARFLRNAQRFVIVNSLAQAINNTNDLTADHVAYQLAAAPAYPELYDNLIGLSEAKRYSVHVVSDVPFRMIPSGVATGREITASDWNNNTNNAPQTGENGFAASGIAEASVFYPHARMSNVDGLNVFVPSSTYALPMLVRADGQGGPWIAPMGFSNGVVSRVSSVGYLNNNDTFVQANITDGQADLLYSNNINFVKNVHRIGMRNMGNKTRLSASSAMNRINTSRLVSKIRYEVRQSMQSYLGRSNGPETWAEVRNQANKYLAGLVSLGAVEDYFVRCDEVINTPDRRARQELWLEMGISAPGVAEFIYVELQVDPPGTIY